MIKARAEIDHMAERMHALEMDNHRHKHTLGGITR